MSPIDRIEISITAYHMFYGIKSTIDGANQIWYSFDMGFHVEINTMFRLGENDPLPEKLQPGIRFTAHKDNNRIFPVDYAILFLSADWKILGYCAIRKSELSNGGTILEVEILSRFSEEEIKIYTARFQKAITMTHELQH